MRLNGLVDMANVVISGPLSSHLFVQIYVFEFGPIPKTTLPRVGDVGSERENTVTLDAYNLSKLCWDSSKY